MSDYNCPECGYGASESEVDELGMIDCYECGVTYEAKIDGV